MPGPSPAARDDGRRATVALARQRQELVALIAGLDEEIEAVVSAARDANGDDEHDPEGPTVAFERAKLMAMRTALRRQAADLDAALMSVQEGTYGSCTQCAGPIGEERLEALPGVRLCVRCAARGG